jgi:hypothetical protein
MLTNRGKRLIINVISGEMYHLITVLQESVNMRKFLSIILTIMLLVMPMAEMTAFAAPSAVTVADTANEAILEIAALAGDTNQCGDNLEWTLDSATGTLTISGNGAIPDYTVTGYYPNTPWSSFADDYGVLTSIVVEEGVTAIGNYAFYDCFYAQTLSLPSTVTDIGTGALEQMGNLQTISVAPANPSYTAVDGVLYDKDVTTLIRAGSLSDPFVMPSTVTGLVASAQLKSWRLSSYPS